MPQPPTSFTSDLSEIPGPNASRTFARATEPRLLFLDAARVLVVISIWASTWMIGGFYPTPRFLTLTLLAAALILFWMQPSQAIKLAGSVRWPWILGLALFGYLALQLSPTFGSMVSWASGTAKLRLIYAPESADTATSLSLVPWLTLNFAVLATIGITGFFFGTSLFNGNAAKRLLLFAIATCGASQVFWGIVQTSVHPDQIFWGMDNESGSIPFGTFLVRNHGADFIAVSLLCAIALLWDLVHQKDKSAFLQYDQGSLWRRFLSEPILLASALLCVWLLAGLLLSCSRGAWLSFLITCICLPLAWTRSGQPRRLGWLAMVLIMGLGCSVLLHIVGLSDRIERRAEDLQFETVLTDGRLELWRDSLPALAFFFPLGSGWGTYRYAYLPFDPTPSSGWHVYAHNLYLETATDAGVPGICLLVFAIYFAARSCLSLCNSRRSTTTQAIGIAAFGCLLFQTAHGLTEFGLMMPANTLVTAILLGVAATTAKSRRGGTASPQLYNHHRQAITGIFSACSITILLGFALWHQAREVRADRLLTDTQFTPSTPSPNVETTDQWISDIEEELQRSRENDSLHRRLIQLQLHRAQRVTYDQIRSGEVKERPPSHPIADWDATTLESLVMQLYDTSDQAPTEIQKQRMRRSLAMEPSIKAAWEDLANSLAANPVQPRTHLRQAQLAAVTGRDWKHSFKHSMKLSVVDPRQSLGNGLLAWAAGDTDAMVHQWRQHLTVDLTHLELIFRLSRLKLTDDAIAERLIPDRWVVPFRLAQILRHNESELAFRELLLEKASLLASKENDDDSKRFRNLAVIANAAEQYQEAAQYYRQAVQSAPKDPELRYFLALALLKSGHPEQAVSEIRVAVHLSPKTARYRQLFERAKRDHFRTM